MNAMERLDQLVKERGPLLAGLDPDLEKIKQINNLTWGHTKVNFEDEEDFYGRLIKEYCVDYIETIKGEVAAIKINIAFFEAYKQEYVFWNVAEMAKEAGLFVIADVKRADIGNTSKQYAQAFLHEKSAIDAITINPYFGTDGVKTFLDMAKENDKGIFVLVKTSNKSSSEIQDLELADGQKVYQKVAGLVKEWGDYTRENENGRYSLVGAVVGATHPEEAKQLREQMPNTFFLVPGYGAQGATARDIVVNFDKTGGGAIVNSSRGLMFAYEKEPWRNEFCIRYWKEATKKAVAASQEELYEAILANRRKN